MSKRFFLLLAATPFFLSGCALPSNVQSVWDGAVSLFDTVKHIGVSVDTNTKQHTVIVPGYGAPVAGNTTYEGYITEVANYVNDTNNDVDAVVFTGSYSSLQDTSEAESMNSYFNSLVDTDTLSGRGVRVYKEECAIVSWQNITYTEELLTADGISPDSIILFGDTARGDKLKTFASFVFNKDVSVPDSAQELLTNGVNYTDIDFRGYDFGNAAMTEAQRNAAFAAEIAGAYDATIGNEILEERIEDWTEEFGYDVADNLVEKGCEQYEGFR